MTHVHVIAALWSSEVNHALRLRRATFAALCPDAVDTLAGWIDGATPSRGVTHVLVLLDPFASGRQRAIVGLDAVASGVKPRHRGYADAATRAAARR